MTPIATLISAFLQQRLPDEQGASPNTVDAYATGFQLLFEFASARLKTQPSQLCLEQIDAPLVLAFLLHLETERGNSRSTRNARLTAIKSFMRFVQYREPSALEQIQQILAIPQKKTDSRLVNHLSIDEMQAMTVKFSKKCSVDLGGIGKGFALDMAAEALSHKYVYVRNAALIIVSKYGTSEHLPQLMKMLNARRSTTSVREAIKKIRERERQ